MKKALSLLLVLAMVLALAPVHISEAQADGEVIELEFLTNSSFGANAGTDLEKDNFVEQYLREHLGVDIKYTYSDDLATTLNLRLMGGDVPAIMSIPDRAHLIEYSGEEYLLNLDDYAAELADALAFTAGNAAAGKVDGSTYAIAGRPYGYRQAWWYDVNSFANAGITELPTTLDEYMDAVRTVMASDPDGNGINDTIGLTGCDTWKTLCRIFGAYGVTIPTALSLDENGNVVDTMLTPEFYDALSYAAGLWSEGIIDHELFSLTATQAVDKCMSGAAVTAYLQWPDIKKEGNWETFQEVSPGAQWEIVGELTGPNGDNYVGNFASVGFTSLHALDAELTGDTLDAALRTLNFFGTDEGLNLTTYGIENEHWDYNDEGVPTVRPDAIQKIDISWIYQLCGREELSYCRVKFGDYAWKYVVQSDEQPYITDVTSLIDQPEGFNRADANTFITEECAKFLSGERTLNESEWQNFLDTLESTYQYSAYIEAANAQWQTING